MALKKIHKKTEKCGHTFIQDEFSARMLCSCLQYCGFDSWPGRIFYDQFVPEWLAYTFPFFLFIYLSAHCITSSTMVAMSPLSSTVCLRISGSDLDLSCSYALVSVTWRLIHSKSLLCRRGSRMSTNENRLRRV